MLCKWASNGCCNSRVLSRIRENAIGQNESVSDKWDSPLRDWVLAGGLQILLKCH